MPELPDVETFKRYLDATALHQPIQRVSVKDTGVLGRTSARSLQHNLKRRAFEATRRHGKNLFVRTAGEHWLRLHFGMTGFLEYYRNDEVQPKHSRVIFHFAEGFDLAYDNQRKLGKVELVEDPETYVQTEQLGPDALDIAFEELDGCLAGHKGALKSVLMNQNVLAGLGNIYTDEILFQARLDPRTCYEKLDRRRRRQLFQNLKKVLNKAIDCQADPGRMPSSFLLPHRAEKHPRCPQCGHRVKQAKVSGRTTYYCPRCQGRS